MLLVLLQGGGQVGPGGVPGGEGLGPVQGDEVVAAAVIELLHLGESSPFFYDKRSRALKVCFFAGFFKINTLTW